jgi:hypothetical protein
MLFQDQGADVLHALGRQAHGNFVVLERQTFLPSARRSSARTRVHTAPAQGMKQAHALRQSRDGRRCIRVIAVLQHCKHCVQRRVQLCGLDGAVAYSCEHLAADC